MGCSQASQPNPTPYIMVLGIAQDAGYPQVGCQKACCAPAWEGEVAPQPVTALGLVAPASKQTWLFEATPDLPQQVRALQESAQAAPLPDGIFLTHAHIGHYTGLMYLGREAYGAQSMPVYTMPRMGQFLTENGPWSQLVTLNNIALTTLQANQPLELTPEISVIPIVVPHRDEFSETVGYRITGPKRTALFIPDIDKWTRWDMDLVEALEEVDVALLDATFYDGDELPGRNMEEIPHPFVIETMAQLEAQPLALRQKVLFIHFNHTNPLLHEGPEKAEAEAKGYRVARQGMRIEL